MVGWLPPAPLTSWCTVPNRSRVSSSAAATLSGDMASHWTAATSPAGDCPLISSALLRPASSEMSQIATLAPAPARPRAISPPIAPPAPVITAFFPPKSNISGPFRCGQCLRVIVSVRNESPMRPARKGPWTDPAAPADNVLHPRIPRFDPVA